MGGNTWFQNNKKRKVGGNRSEIDFVMVGKDNRKYLREMKAMCYEFQHQLGTPDVDKN